jgi:uncharacterized membrane-anchored protein
MMKQLLASRLVLSLAVVALMQTAVLGYMVADRVALLKRGREIHLPIVPVDPRDIFRGDYVTLRFDISQVELPEELRPALKRGDKVFVTLEKGADGAWKAVATSATLPSGPKPEQVVIAGRSQFRRWMPPSGKKVTLRYGIESYFVPEGKGRELERLVRDKKMAAIVAVDARGNAAIKGLAIDGVVRYEEPLF